MLETLLKQYMPHKMCLMPDTWLIGLMAFVDLSIMVAYVVFFLYFLVRMKKNLDAGTPISIFSMSFCFFVLLCGIGHGIEVFNMWNGMYALETAWGVMTSIASWFTVILALRQPAIVDGILEEDRRKANIPINFPDRRQ